MKARDLSKINYQAELNPQQHEVVMAPGGPVLVIAGAGSGKTRAITYRVSHLIESGVDPHRILLVTFTNKAAREMLHRVEILIGLDLRKLWGGTFHHVGNLILRRHAPLLGYTHQYTILDREDSKDLMETCITDIGINTKEKKFPKGDILKDIVSYSVNTEKTIEQVVIDRYPHFHGFMEIIHKITQHYEEKKKKLNLMDYDDLLLNWKVLLEKHPEVKAIYGSRFLHILVDEYQDTNKLQADIVDLLAGNHRNLVVVGDDAQSIYSFRGAHFANIIEFPKRYPDAKLYKLETNYRSTPEILRLANSSILHNQRQFEKVLQAVRQRGSQPVLVPLRDVLHQADFVAGRILELRDDGISLDEMAVLYRSHYHSMELQLELTRRGIPYIVRSGLKFFEQAHIKDVISYLKVLINPLDELAWKRILRLLPKIGRATSDKIFRHLAALPDPLGGLESEETRSLIPKAAIPGWQEFVRLIGILQNPELKKSPATLIELVLKGGYQEYLQSKYTDYRERGEDINQLANFASRYKSLEDFLSELALLGTVESETAVIGSDEEEGRVILSTIHQAKGLEWQAVFMIWLAEGRFPPSRAFDSAEDEEEERRLFYVAATRAKDELYLCYPIVSESWRGLGFLRPSRFIQELDQAAYSKMIQNEDILVLMEKADAEG